MIKINFMTRITLILFGIFITSVTFALTVKAFQEIGIWIGLIISSIIIFCAFYYTMPDTRTRVITWSMLITLIISIILYFAGLSYISKSLEGF